MPPKPLVDLDSLDLETVVAGPEKIRAHNPQRYEMEHLDGILHLDIEEGVVVGFKDVADDEFWVEGHIPGRPLLPGVIMCEAAAQLSSYIYQEQISMDKFLGFGGMQDVKFRRPVKPGQRLILVARARDVRTRRAMYATQAFVNGKMVFEAVIVGMPM